MFALRTQAKSENRGYEQGQMQFCELHVTIEIQFRELQMTIEIKL